MLLNFGYPIKGQSWTPHKDELVRAYDFMSNLYKSASSSFKEVGMDLQSLGTPTPWTQVPLVDLDKLLISL